MQSVFIPDEYLGNCLFLRTFLEECIQEWVPAEDGIYAVVSSIRQMQETTELIWKTWRHLPFFQNYWGNAWEVRPRFEIEAVANQMTAYEFPKLEGFRDSKEVFKALNDSTGYNPTILREDP